jgi:hypothetical protein
MEMGSGGETVGWSNWLALVCGFKSHPPGVCSPYNSSIKIEG